MAPLPYEGATSGKAAVEDMQKILRNFGASSFGCMEDFDAGMLTVQFRYRERSVTISASSKGYAAAWLRVHPYTFRTKSSELDHERKALRIGQVAVYSILRDWIKGQVTAVEIGILSFDGAFLGQIMLPNGETILERVTANRMLALEGPSQ
jgi:hypothetical protein